MSQFIGFAVWIGGRAAAFPNIGDVLAFGTYFHEFFVRNFVDRGMPSRLCGAALSTCEIETLGMLAHGLSSDDIANKCDIAPRIVRFHLDTAHTKMGALTQDEAIAMTPKRDRLVCCLDIRTARKNACLT